MQTISDEGGLKPASQEARRCHITPILGANANMVDGLLAMWAQRTPDEAYRLLASPDVTVTNRRDKDEQLDKLKTLSKEVKACKLTCLPPSLPGSPHTCAATSPLPSGEGHHC